MPKIDLENPDLTPADLIAENWEIVTDGPSGVQMQGPKVMRLLDKLCLAFGVLTFWIYGIGFIFIAIAVIDYLAMTPRQKIFFPRESQETE